MKAALRLPMRFDAAALAREADGLADTWQAHFNTGTYSGEWSGIALRSTAGAQRLDPDFFSNAPIADTAVLERTPAIRAALASFEAPITSARLLRLAPGAHIREHRDYDLGLDVGEVRLHVVVRTNAHVRFSLDGQPVPMRAGECWYLDVSKPHAVTNGGSTERIHLVLDVRLDARLQEMLAAATNDAEHGG
ncbi:MAG: aspartyl/asparaginyl beta-hydroxylase domain-containing protein [bacterium]|nr:aspartyl/asparaginyl beta-hydroxylase domain-containing protein [bacterium]